MTFHYYSLDIIFGELCAIMIAHGESKRISIRHEHFALDRQIIDQFYQQPPPPPPLPPQQRNKSTIILTKHKAKQTERFVSHFAQLKFMHSALMRTDSIFRIWLALFVCFSLNFKRLLPKHIRTNEKTCGVQRDAKILHRPFIFIACTHIRQVRENLRTRPRSAFVHILIVNYPETWSDHTIFATISLSLSPIMCLPSNLSSTAMFTVRPKSNVRCCNFHMYFHCKRNNEYFQQSYFLIVSNNPNQPIGTISSFWQRIKSWHSLQLWSMRCVFGLITFRFQMIPFMEFLRLRFQFHQVSSMLQLLNSGLNWMQLPLLPSPPRPSQPKPPPPITYDQDCA